MTKKNQAQRVADAKKAKQLREKDWAYFASRVVPAPEVIRATVIK